ncbi:hypothetical protein GCM10022219_19480 [Microbacterium oryzae]
MGGSAPEITPAKTADFNEAVLEQDGEVPIDRRPREPRRSYDLPSAYQSAVCDHPSDDAAGGMCIGCEAPVRL